MLLKSIFSKQYTPLPENCKNLKVLAAFQSKLIGTLPQQIFSITTLSLALELDNDLLNDSLSPKVGNLKNLMCFDAFRYRFLGKILVVLKCLFGIS